MLNKGRGAVKTLSCRGENVFSDYANMAFIKCLISWKFNVDKLKLFYNSSKFQNWDRTQNPT